MPPASLHTPLTQTEPKGCLHQVEREHDRVVITKHGRPAAVMLSIDDLASLEESLEILGKPRLVAQIRDSLAELAQDQADVLTKEQALQVLRRLVCRRSTSAGRPRHAAPYRISDDVTLIAIEHRADTYRTR